MLVAVVTSQHEAARRGRTHLQELLDCGVDVSCADYDGRTALHIACCSGNSIVVALLLKHGANTEVSAGHGLCVCVYVCVCVCVCVCVFCIHHMILADIALQCVDRFGNSPLWDAVTHCRVAVVELLVRRGCRLASTPRAAGYMCVAAARDDTTTLKLLLLAGCSPSAADYDGRTALHLACCNGHLHSAFLLLRAGASLSAVDR